MTSYSNKKVKRATAHGTDVPERSPLERNASNICHSASFLAASRFPLNLAIIFPHCIGGAVSHLLASLDCQGFIKFYFILQHAMLLYKALHINKHGENIRIFRTGLSGGINCSICILVAFHILTDTIHSYFCLLAILK